MNVIWDFPFIWARVTLSIDGVGTSLGVLGQIRLHRPSPSKRPVFNHPTARHWITLKCVRSGQYREVGKTDFFRAADPRVGDSKEIRLHGLLGDVKLEIASVVQLGPLKFAVVRQQSAADVVRRCDGNVLTTGAGAGNGGPGKFDPDASFTRAGVILMFAEPDEIASPVRMRVPSNHDIVVDMVFVESLESSIPIGEIAVPSIIIEGVDVTIGFRLVETREDYWSLASQSDGTQDTY